MRRAFYLVVIMSVFFAGCDPAKKSRKKIESLQASVQPQKYEIGMACMQYILKHGGDRSYAKSLVKTLLDLEFYSEAIYGAESLLERYPGDAELLHFRSLGYRRLHQYDLALDDIRRANKLQPRDGVLKRASAQTLEEQRRWTEIETLNQALATRADSFPILIERAEHFFELQEFDAVLFDLGAASKIRAPKDSVYYTEKVSSLYNDSRRPVETLSEILEYFKDLKQ